MYKLIYVLLISVVFFVGCSSESLEVSCIREGEIYSEKIDINKYINREGKLSNTYVDTLNFFILDSINFENNNPDRVVHFTTPVTLNFNKNIEKNSPEYYAISTIHYTTQSINYFNRIFENKINFNNQKSYKNIEVLFGDIALLSTPKQYIYEKNTPLSPSIFYHEVGHRAFWLLESEQGIKFRGLSYLHVGLLEYFTISLNNSPIVGEIILPNNLVRNASFLYNYPHQDSLYYYYTFSLLKEAYSSELKDSTNSISKYYNLAMKKYGPILKKKVDNHRGGLVITNLLWRIRNVLGQDKTDKLVANTILDLNKSLSKRSEFYLSDKDEKLPDKIEWYDLYFGMIHKDKEMYKGANEKLIKEEFKRTGFLIEKVKT